jgi:hypothetical protein
VVLRFDPDADLLHNPAHFGPYVLGLVGRRDGKVPLFVAGFVAKVGALFTARVPSTLNRIQGVEAEVWPLVEADVIKEEKFRLRTEEGRIADPDRL